MFLFEIKPTFLFLSALINKFGNRMVTFVGLLLMCLAVLSISFASAVYLVFFCYALFGVGNGMIHLSGMVICSEYFDKVQKNYML